jgi:peptidylprolyl isomerase
LARREAYHFGHVVEEGMNVVNLIEQNLYQVIIIRKGEAAKKFNATKTFYDYFSVESENQKKKLAVDAK